jgi:hypothetical protein
MAEYLQAPPRRKALGLLADALTSGQEALNTVNLPYVGGLGGLLFGQAPQYLQDVSYGMPAFRGGNVATGGLGTITPDTRMLDVATLPFVGAGAAKAGQVGAKTLGKEIARQVETGTGLIGSNVLDPRQYVTAYHGSPAIFDKFDLSKIGTGQGAQAYGHGMYFAENPAVAKEYQKQLSGWQPGVQSAIKNAGGNIDDAIQQATKSVDHYKNLISQGNLGLSEERANSLLDISTKKLTDLQAMKAGVPENTGAFYKVDIPDEDIPKLLNWDTPIKDQPEMYNLIKKNIKDDDIRRSFENNAESGITGANAYSNYLSGKTNADKSKSALNIGIKGIKYLDQGSREAGGTNNFVIFDPSNVKILERNNKGLLK